MDLLRNESYFLRATNIRRSQMSSFLRPVSWLALLFSHLRFIEPCSPVHHPLVVPWKPQPGLTQYILKR